MLLGCRWVGAESRGCERPAITHAGFCRVHIVAHRLLVGFERNWLAGRGRYLWYCFNCIGVVWVFFLAYSGGLLFKSDRSVSAELEANPQLALLWIGLGLIQATRCVVMSEILQIRLGLPCAVLGVLVAGSLVGVRAPRTLAASLAINSILSLPAVLVILGRLDRRSGLLVSRGAIGGLLVVAFSGIAGLTIGVVRLFEARVVAGQASSKDLIMSAMATFAVVTDTWMMLWSDRRMVNIRSLLERPRFVALLLGALSWAGQLFVLQAVLIQYWLSAVILLLLQVYLWRARPGRTTEIPQPQGPW